MQTDRRILPVFLLNIMLLLTACAPFHVEQGSGMMTGSPEPVQVLITATPFQPSLASLYMTPGIPDELRKEFTKIENLNFVNSQGEANLVLKFTNDTNDEDVLQVFTRIYAAVVPFLTIRDAISVEELKGLWRGHPTEGSITRILATEETVGILDEVWSSHGSTVDVVSSRNISSSLESVENSIAILPFESITPRYKVLKIDGISPLDKPMDASSYALTARMVLLRTTKESGLLDQISGEIIASVPVTNRDEKKMTILVMSGTTAITRGTASKIKLKGIDYPIEAVQDWFLSADLRHVSNEIPFVKDCPEPDPFSTSMRFCAQPEMIEVLERLGVNLVELTGNHENDYGPENFAYTLAVYQEKGWLTFGGGLDAESARQPLLVENNGNKIAFIGCNPAGPVSDWAGEDTPGSARCDEEFYLGEIAELKKQRYVVIATYQHVEIYQYMYAERYQADFEDALMAGADIVQGSQAHFPMGFELVGDQLIHYGLGNFLFDQMDNPVVGTKREFVDRHIIYNGKYMNTELLTALLTDWSRPVPMSPEEREIFLADIFEASIKR